LYDAAFADEVSNNMDSTLMFESLAHAPPTIPAKAGLMDCLVDQAKPLYRTEVHSKAALV
jgi:hypothetical protein